MSLNIKNINNEDSSVIDFFESTVNRLSLKKIKEIETNIVDLTRGNGAQNDINLISATPKLGLYISPQYDIAEYIYRRDLKTPKQESGNNFEMFCKNYCVDTRNVTLNGGNTNVTKIVENIILDDVLLKDNYNTKVENNVDQDIPYFEFLFPLKIIFNNQAASNLGTGAASEKFLYNSFTKYPFLHFRIYKLKKIKMEITAGNSSDPTSGDLNVTVDAFSEANSENNLKYDCNLIFPSSTNSDQIPFTFYSQLISGCMAQTDSDTTLDKQRIMFDDIDAVNTASRKSKKKYSSAINNIQRVDYANDSNGFSFFFSINENQLKIENKKMQNDSFKEKDFSFKVTNITPTTEAGLKDYSNQFLNVVRKNLGFTNFIRGYDYGMNEDLGKINLNVENTGIVDGKIDSIRDAINQITLGSDKKKQIDAIEKENVSGTIRWDLLRWFHYVYKNRKVIGDEGEVTYKYENLHSELSDYFEQTNLSMVTFAACFSRNTLGYYLINVNSMDKLYKTIYKESAENGDYSQVYTLDLEELYNAVLQDIISIEVS
jgi:hypothetical protein